MAEHKIMSDSMKDEMENFFKVCFSVFLLLCYCYIISKYTQKGRIRLLCVIPVVCLFCLLPLSLVTMQLAGLTSFFISFLANSKILLFAFGKGPLCSDPSISLGSFLAVACLPIKIQQNAPHKIIQLRSINIGENNASPKINSNTPENPKKEKESLISYALKGILLIMLTRVYDYTDYINKIHQNLIWVVSCLHTYFSIELVQAIVASLARRFLSIELEPQFKKPYFASSLQDFWGRRWNVRVSNILRPTVYEPIRDKAAGVIGLKWARLLAVLCTFAVSALMHVLIFYYMERKWPTWEITGFFLLHGFALMIEIILKRAISGNFQLPREISGLLVVGFVLVTGFWLFFPSLFQSKALEKAGKEYEALGDFMKGIGQVVSVYGSINT